MFTASKCQGKPEGKCALLLTDFPGLFALIFGAICTFIRHPRSREFGPLIQKLKLGMKTYRSFWTLRGQFPISALEPNLSVERAFTECWSQGRAKLRAFPRRLVGFTQPFRMKYGLPSVHIGRFCNIWLILTLLQ